MENVLLVKRFPSNNTKIWSAHRPSREEAEFRGKIENSEHP